MSELKFSKQHALGRQEVKERITKMENHLKEKYGVNFKWEGDRAEVKAAGVTGTLTLQDKSVDVSLKLGLLMKPMAGKIREAMDKQLERMFA